MPGPTQTRVLFADDEQSALVIGESALRSDPGLAAAVEVTLCGQGDEAAEAVRRGRAEGRPFAVAFIDFLMPPGPDGLETCRQMRAVDPFVHLVIVTARAEVEPRAISAQVPPAHRFFFLRKPVHPDEVRQLCIALTAKWRAEQELAEAQAHLEARVEQRTAELKAANVRMEQEIATRLEAQRDLAMAHFALQHAPDPIYWINADGRIVFANRAARQAWGYPLEGPLDLWVWDPAPHLRGCWAQRFEAVKRMGVTSTESVHRRADGSVFPAEVSAAYLEFESGPYVIAFARDLTHRRAVEAERARLRTAVAEADEVVFVLNPRLETAYANPACERLTGHSIHDLLGRVPPFLRPDAAVPPPGTAVLEALEASGRWTGRLSHRRKDGSPYQLEVTASAVRDVEDGALTIVLVGREASDMEEMEKRLRRSQRMEAIGTLAGGIAHDFNNILAAIHGYTELAVAGNELPPRIRGYLERVLEASRRARDLVHQILTFSRSTSEERRPLNPHLIVGETLKLLRAALPSTVKIEARVNKNCGAVLADPTQMHQVLMNLCTNAHQAMPDGKGVLSIILDQVSIGSADEAAALGIDPGTYVRLVVEDDGVGMEPHVKERIFEPFFTTKPQELGTGMGLATVHSIVSSHGGAIRVESGPGEGARFTVLLPMHAAQVVIEEPETALVPAAGASILVVDDEAPLAQMHAEALRLAGHTATVFVDVHEAMGAFAAAPDSFDLALVDFTMPDMRGDEVTRGFLRLRPGFPVILLSGLNERTSQQSALEAGCAEFVLKPIGPKSLVRLVTRVLRDSAPPQHEERGSR